MTYWRITNAEGLRVGVIGVPTENTHQRTRQTLWLPNSLNFEELWDKATERPVVLDTGQ